ncbi:hypothetical protein ACH0B5_05675 [Ureibacillus sp. 179-F W5.1 NHS]|uniref:hypothetical protein n=1 Tax=Ureibacillus sp. 179-F W5.1 NHS TaxID=3374297 RepID=UPI003879BA7F
MQQLLKRMIWFTLILLILNAVLVPLSTVAQALDAESDKIILENEKSENSSSLSSDDLNIFPSTIIKETENEKIYRLLSVMKNMNIMKSIL